MNKSREKSDFEDPDLAPQVAARCRQTHRKSTLLARNLYRITAIIVVCVIISLTYKNDTSFKQLTDDKPVVIPVFSAVGDKRSLDHTVKHIWRCDDSTQGLKLLRTLTNNIDNTRVNTDLEGNVALTLNLTDLELVQLVDKLSTNGLELLSPQPPQPGSAPTIITTGKTLTYNISLISRK